MNKLHITGVVFGIIGFIIGFMLGGFFSGIGGGICAAVSIYCAYMVRTFIQYRG